MSRKFQYIVQNIGNCDTYDADEKDKTMLLIIKKIGFSNLVLCNLDLDLHPIEKLDQWVSGSVGHFVCLDPDPVSQPGSGSRNPIESGSETPLLCIFLSDE
jgi:hypothetical protein